MDKHIGIDFIYEGVRNICFQHLNTEGKADIDASFEGFNCWRLLHVPEIDVHIALQFRDECAKELDR